MNHKGIVARLCHFLSQGYGINEALAELGLTTNYLTERIRRIDRSKLHQARACYVEGLQRELVQRARLGRACGRLKQVIDDLPELDIPGDDKDEARAYREWRRRNFASDDGVAFGWPVNQSLGEVRRLLQNSGDVEDDEDDDATETVSSPASEAPASSLRGPQTSVTPFAAISSRPPEDANQRRPEPEPEPKLTWYRLFTGRAQLRDEDGNVVRTVMPGQSGYPHERQFINWK